MVPYCAGDITYELELYAAFSEEKQMFSYAGSATFHTFFIHLAANDIYTITVGISGEIKSKLSPIQSSMYRASAKYGIVKERNECCFALYPSSFPLDLSLRLFQYYSYIIE